MSRFRTSAGLSPQDAPPPPVELLAAGRLGFDLTAVRQLHLAIAEFGGVSATQIPTIGNRVLTFDQTAANATVAHPCGLTAFRVIKADGQRCTWVVVANAPHVRLPARSGRAMYLLVDVMVRGLWAHRPRKGICW